MADHVTAFVLRSPGATGFTGVVTRPGRVTWRIGP